MNYIDIILLVVGALLIVSGLVFGITSQFLFPVVAGLFGASLLSNLVLSWLNSPNEVVVIVVYALLALFLSGIGILVFKILRLSKDFGLGSRFFGTLTALASVAFILVATSRSIPLFANFLNSEFVEAVNQSLLLSFIK